MRGAPAAAGWPHGTPLIPTRAGGDSGPLRLVLGGHSRAPWVAAPPLGVHRVSVVHLHRLDRIATAESVFENSPGEGTGPTGTGHFWQIL